MKQPRPTIQQRPPRRRGKWDSLAHSLYITKAWNWFLEFMGRAAEAILVISVLYASVKLLPVVHMPAGLDVVVFIAQFVALDVGGLSLGKLAKQARTEGNEEGAKQAGTMSKALITVMIVGVVVVAIEQLFPIPANWKIGIDTILLIARSILAVLYGHIIHSLRNEDLFDQAQPPGAAHQLLDLQALISWSVVGMAAHLQQEYQQIARDQAHNLASIQQVQNASATVPEVDTQTVIQAVAEYLIPQFQAKIQALDQAISKQNVTISEVMNQAKRLPENAASVQVAQATFRQRTQATKTSSSQVRQAEQNVIRLIPANASRDELKAEAIRLHTVEGLSSYKIAERFGKSAKTIQSWLSSGKDQAESEEIEQAN